MRILRTLGLDMWNIWVFEVWMRKKLRVRSPGEEMEHVRKLSALGVESVETSGSSHSGDTGMEGLELENDGNSESSRSGDTERENV